jgi:hypothetical protein
LARGQEIVPQRETTYERSERTVYREETRTETRESVRTVWCPVTEYRCEAYWTNWWNPFERPYMAYRQVPHTRWEPRQEVVKTPVVTRTIVPEKQIVNVPVTKRWLARSDGSPISSSLAKKPDPFAPLKPQATASVPSVGGVMIQSDPPRAPGWQSFRGWRY